MKLNFASIPLQRAGLSERPMTILDASEPKAMLSAIVDIALVETGDRGARERWQKTQLRNLLKHARERSGFWRKRIGDKHPSAIELAALPVQTRKDVIDQVAAEGSLLKPGDGIPVEDNATSGSSGMPVRFSLSAVNGQYNVVRSAAQYFIEGRDISLNRTRLRETYEPQTAKGVFVTRRDSWLGPLAPLFRSGFNKQIDYRVADVGRLAAELQKDAVGYLICPPRILETIFATDDPECLKRARVHTWVCVAEGVSEDLRRIFSDLEIPIRSIYSSEEVGPIGYECPVCPGHFHVATSNVLVEVGDTAYDISGTRLGKVFVTHLHSYATPFIRYDVGDLARLRESCPCGHDGPAITDLYGRLSGVLKHADGRITPFHIRSIDLSPLARFTEFRIRQTALDRIVLEIGGRADLSPQETDALRTFLARRAGAGFDFDIKACREIDWGGSSKRHGFRCDIA